MIYKLERWRARLRHYLNRSEYLVRLLGLSKPNTQGSKDAAGQQRGLILLQVDGLSYNQCQKACAAGHMPFLKSLMARENYHLHSLYSGLPSSTPAVQAELFYGLKNAVPGFGFKQHQSGRIVNMLEPSAVSALEKYLQTKGDPLLKDGSAYANIFTGGAQEAHFCASSAGWGYLVRQLNPATIALFILFNLFSFVRVLALMLLELALALFDFMRGLIGGGQIPRELLIIPTRVAICILLRELTTIGVKLDATRGLPIIHANFPGYDEQAHRRGPSSAFAHWSLKGIDDAISRIWHGAQESKYRDYDLWIYSDHGQERTLSYRDTFLIEVQAAIEQVFAGLNTKTTQAQAEAMANALGGVNQPLDPSLKAAQESSSAAQVQGAEGLEGAPYKESTPYKKSAPHKESTIHKESSKSPKAPAKNSFAAHKLSQQGEQTQRAKLLGGKHLQKILRRYALAPPLKDHEKPLVAAMGPLGFVYSPHRLSPSQQDYIAWAMVHQANIPMVVTRAHAPEPGRRLCVWLKGACYFLPAHSAQIFGADHPFLAELCADLLRLCQHPDAGDFVLSGWKLGQKPLSFCSENGSHGGPGPEETHAFALLPADTPVPAKAGDLSDVKDYLRPLDLRLAALAILGRKKPATQFAVIAPRPKNDRNLRVMTYNVHSCIGMDGKLDPARIARVIAQYQPDIVALQELDVGRLRTRGVDQAHLIARALEMTGHFHPVLQLEEECYGNAILSHFPMRLMKTGHYPMPSHKPHLEPRGALWVELDVHGAKIQVMNTHFGLSAQERRLEVTELLGPQWIGHPLCTEALIVCGDFNATPWQYASRRLGASLRDIQTKTQNHRPKNTFSGRYPGLRLDHIYISAALQVAAVAVPCTSLARVSSDHLPLYVDLNLEGIFNPKATNHGRLEGTIGI